jgi:hypothetical protein
MKKLSKRAKIIYGVLGFLVVALIVFRLMLPSILLRYVNRQLTLIDGYEGHVDDIDVSLYRGAYTIRGIKLDKTGGKIPVPFFNAETIDLSVEWRALFHGRVVAEIITNKPELNFVKGPNKETSQTNIDSDWKVVVDHLIPFKLNRFEINEGEIHYRDFHSSPKVDVKAQHVHVLAENLTNANHAKDSLPSTVSATASVYDGNVSLNMKIDPLYKTPTFDANAKMTTLTLSKLNDFLRAYGNFDVEKGTFSLYTEAAAKDGKITGYTKPIIKDMKVVSWKEDKDQPLKFIWESLIELVGWVLNNKDKDQIATKASFEGSIKNPDVDVWSTIGQLLRNAFIQALYPSLENSISLNSVEKKEAKKNFFQKIFGPEETPDKNKKEADDSKQKTKEK